LQLSFLLGSTGQFQAVHFGVKNMPENKKTKETAMTMSPVSEAYFIGSVNV
jgi:hypothetical protein